MKGKIIGVFIVMAGAVAVAFVPTTKSDAQSCGVPVRKVINTYSPPVAHYDDHVVKEIVTPIAVPILVPAFQFQYSPPGYGVPVINQPGAYGPVGYGAMPPAQSPVGNPAAGNPYSMPAPAVGNPGVQAPAVGNQQDRIKELAKALLEEMQKQSPANPGEQEDQGPPVVLDPTTPVNPAPSFLPGTGVVGAVPSRSGQQQPQVNQAALAQFSYAALQRNCAACHTGLGSKGDTVIFTQPGILNPQSPWKTMAKEIQSGRMPPRASQYKMTSQEGQAVTTWLASL